MFELMIVGGLLLMAFGALQIRFGAVQKELAPFIPDLAAGNGSSNSIATFRERADAVFARHNVTSLKKKRALTGYARMIARKNLTPEQNQRVMDMLKQHQIYPA